MGNLDLSSILSGYSSPMLKTADANDTEAEMLFDLWSASRAIKTGERVQDREYSVPSEYPSNKLLKLRSYGLVEGSGQKVRFTDRAARVIRNFVLGEGNTFCKSSVKKPYSLILASNKPTLRHGMKNRVAGKQFNMRIEEVSIDKIKVGDLVEGPNGFAAVKKADNSDANVLLTLATGLTFQVPFGSIVKRLFDPKIKQEAAAHKQVFQTYSIESDSGGNDHDVTVYADGTMMCDCMHWKFQKKPAEERDCKHTKRVKNYPAVKTLQERANRWRYIPNDEIEGERTQWGPKTEPKTAPKAAPKAPKAPKAAPKTAPQAAQKAAPKIEPAKPIEPPKPKGFSIELPKGYSVHRGANNSYMVNTPSGSTMEIESWWPETQVAIDVWQTWLNNELGVANQTWTIHEEGKKFIAKGPKGEATESKPSIEQAAQEAIGVARMPQPGKVVNMDRVRELMDEYRDDTPDTLSLSTPRILKLSFKDLQ
jgi:hypothetical protein